MKKQHVARILAVIITVGIISFSVWAVGIIPTIACIILTPFAVGVYKLLKWTGENII
jgi:hypothetical protein